MYGSGAIGTPKIRKQCIHAYPNFTHFMIWINDMVESIVFG